MRILILTGGEDAAPLLHGLSSEDLACECRSSADFFSCCASFFLLRRLRWLEKHPKTCHRRGLPHKMLARSARELRLYLEQEQFDAIVCTQVLPGLLLTEALRQHPLTAKTCLVATEDTCRPGTELCDMDWFVLSREELRPLFTARGIPAEKLICRCQSPKGA